MYRPHQTSRCCSAHPILEPTPRSPDAIDYLLRLKVTTACLPVSALLISTGSYWKADHRPNQRPQRLPSDDSPNYHTRITHAQSALAIRKVRHNAKIGADIAVELAALSGHGAPSQSGSLAGATTQTEVPDRSPSTAPRNRPPRVAVFGGAVADIVSRPYPGSALTPGTSTPGETRRSFGGVGRNVAEGLARVLPKRWPSGEMEIGDESGSSSAEISLVSAVGDDDAGKSLVAGCEEVGVRAQATVEMGPDGGDNGGRDACRDKPGTASYVAMLDGDGELVAAVADMRVLEAMTAVRAWRRRFCLAEGRAVVGHCYRTPRVVG